MLCFLGTLPDGTNLEAQLVAGNFAVVAEGRSNSIARSGNSSLGLVERFDPRALSLKLLLVRR
jgi:hypothetical protein